MKRRGLLAALSSATVLVAGCGGDAEPIDASPTPEPTVPANVTTVTERAPPPTPGGIDDAAAARAFVERHERRYVFNELAGGIGGSAPAVDVTVDTVAVASVFSTKRGYYLLSACGGRAEYYEPGSASSSGGRNADSVAHFVGDGVHRRIPFNAYQCREPAVTATEDGPTARLQLYDFESEPGYDDPDSGGHRVDVTVTTDGETVFDDTLQSSLPLTVQPRVTTEPGSYTITASLDDGTSAEREWSLSTPENPEWWAVAIVITAGGDLTIRRFYPDETVGLPSGTLCER